MKLQLFIGNDCKPCELAEKGFRLRYADEVKSGEAEIINLEENEAAQEFWMAHELPVAPVVIAVSDQGKLVAVMEVDNLVELAIS